MPAGKVWPLRNGLGPHFSMSTTWKHLICLVCVIVVACANKRSDDKADASTEPTLAIVTADRTDLLLRYAGEGGTRVTATTIDEIPVDARGAVQVVDLALSPAARAASQYVQIFDLRKPNDGGRFPGRLVERGRLEAELAERNVRPPQPDVTMYSASWCGVCKKARRFLTKEGIAFVEKDVEKEPGAAQELARKAQAAGVQTGGVPVFDIGGRVMSGFDGPRILELVRGKDG